MADQNNRDLDIAHAQEADLIIAQAKSLGGANAGIGGFLTAMALAKGGAIEGKVDFNPMLEAFKHGEVRKANSIARQLRNHDIRKGRVQRFPSWKTGVSEGEHGAVAKAGGALDVGGLTDFSQVTGGQALGLMSLDTKLARGTVRPRSFTLFNYLNKTMAGQIVDFWGYVSGTGGGLPGTAYSSFASQTVGTIGISTGSYENKFLRLKLATDGRAITMALASSNNYINVADAENANAAITILGTVNWACYWGNPTLYPNQQQGVAGYIPAKNVVDFWAWYNTPQVQALGVSPQQAMFNLLYNQTAFLSALRQNGQVTHAFMSAIMAGDLQSLVTMNLRNIANDVTDFQQNHRGIVVNGDLVGMNSRFGDVAFPVDVFITARDIAAQAQVDEVTNSPASLPTTVLAAPASVTVAVASGVAGSEFYANGGFSGVGYAYAAATADSGMNESVLTWAAATSGNVPVGGAAQVTITPGAAVAGSTPVAFRVFRSGANYNATGQNPAAVRWIGDIALNGTNPVVFQDLNGHIPGSESIFLFDMDDEDDALDYRMMLPLTKIELFAQNLFMPWAVAHIGAIRPRVPKWHGLITNYPVSTPEFSPTAANTNASV